MTHVLFWDIDGTLLTTGRAGIYAWEQAVHDVSGAPTDLQDLQTGGLTDSQIAALLVERWGGQATPGTVSAMLRAYESHLPERLTWRRGHVMPGVAEILDDLDARDGVLSLLLTGNTRAGAEAKLSHYGLDGRLLDGGFCADGDNRETIARRAWGLASSQTDGEASAERAYVIGDTPHDVTCARAIGVRAVAVATGPYDRRELAGSDPWRVLDELPPPDRFAELLALPART